MRGRKDPERIREMIERRFLGESVTDIANDIGVSRQYVYSVFSLIPRGTANPDDIKSIPFKTKCEVATDFLGRAPSRTYLNNHDPEEYVSRSIPELAMKYDLTKNQVLTILHWLSAYRPSISESKFYTALTRWRELNAVSLRTLSEVTGCSIAILREIFRGWRHMPLEVALKLKAYSGLKISEIYGDLIRMDQEREEGEA